MMRRVFMIALLAFLALMLTSRACAVVPGYTYKIPITVDYQGARDIYYYPIIVDLNLQPYTMSDYNDIFVTIDGAPAKFSKEVLPDGNVRLYIYFDQITTQSTYHVDVYVGREGDVDHSIPIEDALGTYLAVRFHDGPLDGPTWEPAWNEISSCSKRYWNDGGRDAFDKFLYPILITNGDSVNLRVSPRSSCRPRTYTTDGVQYIVDQFAYGYAPGDTSAPHEVGGHSQRIWAQEILPDCYTRDRNVSLSYRVDGHLGSDGHTHFWSYAVDTPFGTFNYYETSDDADPNATSGDPQIHYFVITGDGKQSETFWVDNDYVQHMITYEGIPTPITYLLFVGDVHEYVDDWIRENMYLGTPCAASDPVDVTVGSVQYIRDVDMTVPATMLRAHDYNIEVYYTGGGEIYAVTDFDAHITFTQVDTNQYVGTLSIDTSVPVGQHQITLYEDNVAVVTRFFEVVCGGSPQIGVVDIPETVNTGDITTARIPISCAGDACANVHVFADINGCEMISPEYDTGFVDENAVTYAYVSFICYNRGTFDMEIRATATGGTATRIHTVSVDTLTADISPIISAQDIVDPYADVHVVVTANGYDGNVTLSLVDTDFNPLVVREMNSDGSGIFYADLYLDGVDDGQYYLIASGDTFSVARVLVVSSYAFMNPYGVLVEDDWGKPASIMYARANGDTLTYTVKIYNPRTTPYSALTDEWLSNGGIVQLPSDFASVVDTIAVHDDLNNEYTVTTNISGGAIAVVWSSDTHVLTLSPGSNVYDITMKSPYVQSLEAIYDMTNDPQIQMYLQEALDANYVYQQAQAYLKAVQYMNSAMYGGISIDVEIPPEIVAGQSATGFVYVRNSAGPIDPASIACKLVDGTGNEIGSCALTHIDTGVYSVDLNTDSVGVFGITVTAVSGLYIAHDTAYYRVDSAYAPGKIVVTNFVVSPNTTTKVIYAQDPAATVTVTMYDPSGNVITSGVATYDAQIGAFVYDLNVGNAPQGDYIIVASDNFGYSDRAIVHVSPILDEILASVQDINTFLHDVIAPKLDALQQDVDSILDGQQNLYAAVEEVNANTTQIISLIGQMEQNIDTQHAETIAYLQELNTTAHQILQEVLYIKQRIDDVVIVKLDRILTNQQDMNATLTDIESMLDCNTPSAVCLQLQAIRLSIEDLNDTITANHEEVVNSLSTIESKVDTLQTYISNVKELLECNTPYPSTSVCARLDTLQTQVESIDDEITDMNAFLNQIYDYVRNDLTNEVISVGYKVEDLNNYLHGDVWNKLVDIHQKVNGLYAETNDIKTLIQGHDAIVQAQLDALMNYLSDVNATLYQRIEQMQTTILGRLDTINADTNDILDNTNTLLNYFMCTQPNEVCDSLNDIRQLAEEINTTNYEIISDVNSVRALTLSGFDQVNERLDAIESNVATLRNLLECQQYPQSSVCARLDSILEDTNNIKASIADLNEEILDLYHEVQEEIDAVHTMAGGGGGGGPSAITPIKVAYKAGQVFVAIPEYVPPGTYEVQYSGSLYRFVKKPAPGDEIELKNGIIELELMPGASGVISGEVRLIRGTRTYIIRVDLVADDRLNQIVSVHPTEDRIRVSIPEGGATVIVKGPLANCVSSERFYFAKEGTYEIKKTCDADGVLEVIPNSLHQASIQISISQKPQSIVQAQDILHTTIIPMAAFFVLAAIVSWLGLL